MYEFHTPITDPVLVFALVLFIILLAPLVLKKLKIPSIIGLILAGVVFGPKGANLLLRDSSIVLFSTVGLLYLMFLAGLELDMNEFKKNKNRSLVFGFFTFIIPFALGTLVCHYILHFNTIASILTASMFSTHTLVAYPIASRLGILKNEATTISVGGTIITDIAVLLVLAVITGSKEGELDMNFWIRMTVSLTVFSVIIFWVFPRIGRWFFRNMEGENIAEYIFVLAMLFLAAFLSQLAGVEPIIGAFLAGLSLNRLIPHTSALMNRIEFVGNAIFIPFFLIGVGMLVDLRILFHGPEAIIIALVLTGTAVASKWMAAFVTQKIYGYSAVQRRVIFGLSSAHAAATLAVILVGFNLGILDEKVLNGTILLILFTCLISSFVTEQAGRKLAITEGERLPSLSEVPERILVPVHNPETMGRMIDFAIMIKDPQSLEPIYPITVVKDNEEAKEKVLVSNKLLEKAAIQASASGNNVHLLTRVDLNVSSGLCRAVKEMLVTEIVIGWEKRASTADRIFGTALDALLDTCTQATYVCKLHGPLNTTRKIVVIFPQNCELESGFSAWVKKIKILANSTGARLYFFGSVISLEKLKIEINKAKPRVDAKYTNFEDWEDFLILSRIITEDDLFVVVSARKGSISYNNYLDQIPKKILKHFEKINTVIVYPEQNT